MYFEYLKSRGRDVGQLIGITDYIDFKSLGYKGDPIEFGGRFNVMPLEYGAKKNWYVLIVTCMAPVRTVRAGAFFLL